MSLTEQELLRGWSTTTRFRTEIETYLQHNHDPLTADDRTILERWSRDSRADKIWEKMVSSAKSSQTITPPYSQSITSYGLITTVLGSKKKLRPGSNKSKKDYEIAVRKCNELAALWQSLSVVDYVLINREQAKALEYLMKGRLLLEQLEGDGRKQDERRQILDFGAKVACVFMEMLGRPFDEQVAMLAQIAFDRSDITGNQFKQARKPPRRTL